MTLRQRRSILVLFVLAAAVLPALAQAPAAAPTSAPAAAAGGSMTTLWDLWKVGGIVMYPILGLCIGAVTLAVFGYMNTPEKKMLTPHLVPQIQEFLDKLDLHEVQTVCSANPSLLTNILSAGIQRIGDDGVVDVPSMEKAMEEASVEEAAAGLRTISYLSICAQLAPMLGLLGTVTGMIKAFDAISKGGMGKPDALAGNIGEAMITTAFGLIVGIPAMFAYFQLKTRYNANLARLSRVLGNLTHRLTEALRKSAAVGASVRVGNLL
jgi:biopolymer transport protein ExbB